MDLERQEWLMHSATLKARDGAMKRRNVRLNELLAVCAMSTDPKVSAAYGRYEALAEAVALVSPEKEDK